MYKHLFRTALGLMGLMGTLAIGVVNAQEINKDIVLEATSTAANQTLKINKYFKNAYTVDRGDGSSVETVSSDKTHTYSVASGYTITLSLSGADRWTFTNKNNSKPLVPTYGTTMTGIKITSMPSLAEGFGESATAPGDYFFSYFNLNGAITSLPECSFDTSNIIVVGNYFFRNFNSYGQLTSLPEGSFNISKITTVGDNFFMYFNANGQIKELPELSFRFSTGLTTVGNDFFVWFNREGALSNLPEGSFNTENITTVGENFFGAFNSNTVFVSGALMSLPKGSFDISNITIVGDGFFNSFNNWGALTSLSTGSFKFSTGLMIANSDFFSSFNENGSLISLPEGSFDTSNIKSVEYSFFSSFNENGSLISLPEGSFDTSNITTTNDDFFWKFNYNGAIIDLSNSFIINSIGVSQDYGYNNAFNSTGYMLNRKVSDLVSGVTVPSSDRNTFSDNQPGRCGVHENWLVTPATACKTVTFETNSGSSVDSQIVDIDANEKVIKPTDPTKTGHTFTGWYSDENLTEVFDFSTVITDDTTLYAKWQVNQYIITLDIDGTLTTITGDYDSPVNKPANPTKNGYTFKGWEPEIPDIMPAEDMTVKAKWEKIGSSGGGGGGGGGGGSSSSSSTGSNTTTDGDNSNNTGNQQTGSGANSSTGIQNDQPTSGTNIKEPEANTGSNIQTGNQVDSSEQAPQNDTQGTEDSSSNTSEGQTYTPEFQQAYEFAKGHGITTMPTIQKADMDGKLTRIAMAKMLSQYAVNILRQKPSDIEVPKFNDVTDKQNSDYDNGVTLAYQLGIMWQNMPNNKFRPNDEVTRAEFATALSRMIYGTSDGEYKATSKYYIHHMEKLVEEGIITKDDPKMKELRGYVMIMLMRSAK